MNVPLAGGTVGALKTESELTYVADVVVVVWVVAVVVVVLVAICMLYVVVANRASTEASPTGNAYMYMRGEVTPQMS